MVKRASKVGTSKVGRVMEAYSDSQTRWLKLAQFSMQPLRVSA